MEKQQQGYGHKRLQGERGVRPAAGGSGAISMAWGLLSCPVVLLSVGNPAEGHQMVLLSKLPAHIYLKNVATCRQGFCRVDE
jgi:hypothetical protein